MSTKAQYEKLLEVKDQIPHVELVISYERFMGDRSFPVYTQYQLSEVSTPVGQADRDYIEDKIAQINHEDILTVIYTSGTTGPPKGVILTQYNIICNVSQGLSQIGGLAKDETFLSFLPLSHILERTGGYYVSLMSGKHIAFAEDVKKVVENMDEIKPTFMICVPRLFEKVYSRIHESAHQMSSLRKTLFHEAVKTGREYVNKKYIDKTPVGLLGIKYQIFDRLVFKKIRKRFGGRLRGMICGGAPLDKTINEFMWAIGVPVFNGYGLTETSPVVTLSSIDEVRFDAVGKKVDRTEVKLAEDGELLVKGPQVMKSYFKNEEATEKTFVDGWFKTGDIARIDEQGFIYIIDRKKEILVTAGGKNIAPQPIENELKLDKFISQAIIFGDRQPYLTALLTPNIERLIDYSRANQIDYIDIYELVKSSRITKLYDDRIDALNRKLPPYSTIKYFALVPKDFSIEGGELTPTLKLKRKEIYNKYKAIVDEMYMSQENGVVFKNKAVAGETQ